MNFLLRAGSRYTWGEEVLIQFEHLKGLPRLIYQGLSESYLLVYLEQEEDGDKFLRTLPLTPQYSPGEERRSRARVAKDQRYVGRFLLVELSRGPPPLDTKEVHHALSELVASYPCYQGLIDLSKWRLVLLNRHPDWKYTWPCDTVSAQYQQYRDRLLEEMRREFGKNENESSNKNAKHENADHEKYEKYMKITTKERRLRHDPLSV